MTKKERKFFFSLEEEGESPFYRGLSPTLNYVKVTGKIPVTLRDFNLHSRECIIEKNKTEKTKKKQNN